MADFEDMPPAKPTKKNPESPLSQVNPRMPHVEADRGPVQRSSTSTSEDGGSLNEPRRGHQQPAQEQPKGTREQEHVSATELAKQKQNGTVSTAKEPEPNANDEAHLPASSQPGNDTTHQGERTSIEEAKSQMAGVTAAAHAPAHLPGAESTASGGGKDAARTYVAGFPGGKKILPYADWLHNRLGGGNAPLSYFQEKAPEALQRAQETWAGAAGDLGGKVGVGLAAGPLLRAGTVAGSALKGAAAGGASDVLENGVARTKEDALRLATAVGSGAAFNAGGKVGERVLGGTGRWAENRGDEAAMRAAHQGGPAAEALERAKQSGQYVPGSKNRELEKAGVVRFSKEGVREGAAASKESGAKLINSATENVPGVPAGHAASRLTGVIQEHGYGQPGATLAGEGIGPVASVRNKLQGEADVVGERGSKSLSELLKQKPAPGTPEAAEVKRQLDDLVARRQGARAGLRPQDLSGHARDIEEATHGVQGPGAKVAGKAVDTLRELETSNVPSASIPDYREGQRQYAIGSRAQSGLQRSAAAGANQEIATRAGMRRSFLAQPLNAAVAKGARVAGPALQAGGGAVQAYGSKRAVMPQAGSEPESQDSSGAAPQWLEAFGGAMNNAKEAPSSDPGSTTNFDQAVQSSPTARSAMKRDAANSGDKRKNNRVNPGSDTTGN